MPNSISNLHPCKELNDAFRKKPFQGAHPSCAKYIFFGLDANFDKNIETKEYFHEIMRYLDDGVLYWKREGVHHPFLNERINYSGSGKQYHQRFSWLGFTEDQAEDVSFVELLDVPTFGRCNFKFEDLNVTHIESIIRWVFSGRSKYIFIPAGPALMLRKFKEFSFLNKKTADMETMCSIPLWGTCPNKFFFKVRHFTYISKEQCNHIISLPS